MQNTVSVTTGNSFNQTMAILSTAWQCRPHMTYQSLKNISKKELHCWTTRCWKHIFSHTLAKSEHFVNKVNEVLTLVEPLHPHKIGYNQLQTAGKQILKELLRTTWERYLKFSHHINQTIHKKTIHLVQWNTTTVYSSMTTCFSIKKNSHRANITKIFKIR
jgi:hypothetical protein